MGGANRRRRRRLDSWSLAAGFVAGWVLLFFALGPLADQAAGGSQASPAALLSPEGAIRAAAFRVDTRGCGRFGGGTAVATTEGVLTNRHVAEAASVLTVAGVSATGRSLADGMDAALIGMAAPWSGPELELADVLPAEGVEVLVAGYPGGGPLEVARGRVLSHSDQEYWGGGSGPLLIVDVQVSPGWSGGPVVDLDGRMVGIVRGSETSTGVTVVEPSTALLEWLDTAPSLETVAADTARCEPG
ncbi:MAG: trypsin-like peptidase domain-containing protein [Actinomycetia bacterium]|nr:trypsin-like peptidase domain-containing protein [Actinomycetes bacterium]